MSPTYPTQDKADLRKQLERIAECDPAVVFHEPINPRGGNFEMTVQAARDAGEEQADLDLLRDRDRWAEYATNHLRWVQKIGEELGLPIHLWPDKQLIKHVSDGASVAAILARSPIAGKFAERETPNSRTPHIPHARS